MEATLSSGLHAAIGQAGASLAISDEKDVTIAVLPAPAHAGFYQFAQHAVHGVCPIVSFEPAHAVNGWSDWYYLVSQDGKSIERLNPWR
jgi:hypothetical protein